MEEDLIVKSRRKWSILNDQLVESHYTVHLVLFLEQNTVSFSFLLTFSAFLFFRELVTWQHPSHFMKSWTFLCLQLT